MILHSEILFHKLLKNSAIREIVKKQIKLLSISALAYLMKKQKRLTIINPKT